MDSNYWLTVGLAAVIAAFLGATVSVWTVTRTIKQKSVIEERQKWRDALRELVPNLIATQDAVQRSRIRNTLALKLNPSDQSDVEAIELMDEFISDPSTFRAAKVVTKFQQMLKIDWERAKIEASLRPCFAAQRAANRVAKQERRHRARELDSPNKQTESARSR